MVARETGVEVEIEQNPTSLIAPPRYAIEQIDLVTEGAVTLNQAYNLLSEDVDRLKEDSGVTELCLLLNVADRVNFLVGDASNQGSDDIAFRQRGVLTRRVLIPLFVEKLRQMGKLVTVKNV